jgi:hypothetical protein
MRSVWNETPPYAGGTSRLTLNMKIHRPTRQRLPGAAALSPAERGLANLEIPAQRILSHDVVSNERG